MCMKYEKEYKGGCWDYLFFRVAEEESLVRLLDYYGVSVKKPDEFKEKMMGLFAQLHELGIIEPDKE